MFNTMKQAGKALSKAGAANHHIAEREVDGVTKYEVVANSITETSEGSTDTSTHEPANENVTTPPVIEQPAPVVVAPVAPTFVMPEGVTTNKPVAFVWAFLAANTGVERKLQIKHMVGELGLNKNMASTQTARFYKTGGDKAKWLAIENAQRKEAADKIKALVEAQKAQALANAPVATPEVEAPAEQPDLEALAAAAAAAAMQAAAE